MYIVQMLIGEIPSARSSQCGISHNHPKAVPTERDRIRLCADSKPGYKVHSPDFTGYGHFTFDE